MTNEKIVSQETIVDNPFPQREEAGFGAPKTGTIKDQSFPKKTTSNIIGSMLNTKARNILGEFTFTQTGAIQIGRYVAGSSGEIKISPDGIVGKNSDGEITFTIDGVTGDAIFRGTLYATAGDIGGFTIKSSYLHAGSGTSVAGVSPVDYPFWAGAAYADRATAPFRVTPDGALVAENATISGTITATAIDIGGSDATSFHVDVDGNTWSGHATFASAPFKVSNAGALTASNISVTGGSITGSTQIQVGGVNIVGNGIVMENLKSILFNHAVGGGSNQIITSDADNSLRLNATAGFIFGGMITSTSNQIKLGDYTLTLTDDVSLP